MNAAQQQQYDQGLTTRKQVMGEDFVARALAGIHRSPHPSRSTSRAQRLGRRVAARRPGPQDAQPGHRGHARGPGRPHELKGHVRGALNNGASVQEIQEVLLHAAIYCGVPSAVDAFRAAAEVVEPAAPR
jgi:4-carboxymuconolactone decarboxylase